MLDAMTFWTHKIDLRSLDETLGGSAEPLHFRWWLFSTHVSGETQAAGTAPLPPLLLICLQFISFLECFMVIVQILYVPSKSE